MVFNLNDPNTITATIALITEIILFAIFVIAKKKSNNFEKAGFDHYVYVAVLLNIVVSFTWMIPRAVANSKYSLGQPGFEKLIFALFGGFIGIITFLFAIILCIQLFSRRSSANKANQFYIRRVKILSSFTFIFWLVTLLIGVLLYYLTYF